MTVGRYGPTAIMPRREGRDRFTTASWCRSAMISRCSDTRDRTMNRSEWSSEKTDATNRGYRRTHVTSIDATRTVFSIATPPLRYAGDLDGVMRVGLIRFHGSPHPPTSVCDHIEL